MKSGSYSFKTESFILLIPLFIGAYILVSCSPSASSVPRTYTGYYFNTVIQLTFYNDSDAALSSECFNICDKYEHLLSRTLEGSDIYNINHANGVPTEVSEETIYLLEQSIHYSEISNGKIDCTIAPLMDLWDFTSGNTTQPPKQQDIAIILPHINYKNIHIDGSTVTLSDSKAQIDLGFIAKGYIADQIKNYLVQQGVQSAIIDLGGNILTIQTKPNGDPYLVGIQKPFAEGNTTACVESISDSSVVTSGIYERYFTCQDTIYHHILDPKTGYPIQNNLYGVTILSKESCIGDALSTTCLVLGFDDAMQLIQATDGVEAIFITEDGTITRTEEIKP